MRTLWVATALLFVPSLAAADEEYIELGAFFGPRIFSNDALLGYNETAPFHPDLRSGMGLGARIGRRFWKPWLVPEFELAVVPTKTTTEANVDTGVVWLEPRVHARIDLMPPERRFNAFVVVGGGAPIALSSARRTFNSGIVGEGYVGGGLRFDSYKGFVIRLDARVSALPSAARMGLIFEWVNLEADFKIGIEFALGKPARPREPEPVVEAAPPGDRDQDNISDRDDKCPDRAEDADNFEDADGCPDIDNDNDRVLDIADKCPAESETINGFNDDDGCADTIPADLDAMQGTIEGLLYAEGETAVRASAKKSIQKIAKTLTANPTIRISVIGHTDDREAKAFASPNAGDVSAIAVDLSRARAEAVRQALISAGIPSSRIAVDGSGAEQPVSDNATAKGRLANRRVEIKLYIPK